MARGPSRLTLRALSADAARRPIFGKGRVHSVFERVINIEDAHGELVTLAARDVDNAPSSIVVDCASFAGMDVRVGDEVRAVRDALIVGERFSVRLESARAWKSTLPAWPADDSWLRRNLAAIRIHRAPASPPVAMAMRLLDARSGALCAALVHGDADAAREHGRALLGLGPGLTPSGDDFLVGLFAVLSIPGSPCERLRGIGLDIVSDVHRRTNAVSAAALVAAARGRVRESIVALLRALLIGDRDVATALKRVLAIGSTSGSDIAAGLLAGLRIPLSPAWKPQPTSRAA